MFYPDASVAIRYTVAVKDNFVVTPEIDGNEATVIRFTRQLSRVGFRRVVRVQDARKQDIKVSGDIKFRPAVAAGRDGMVTSQFQVQLNPLRR